MRKRKKLFLDVSKNEKKSVLKKYWKNETKPTLKMFLILHKME